MRNYKIWAMALMMATMLAGCSQDEGNYDYHSLNEPTITGVPENISVLTHANIDLDPNLGDNITDLDAYNYEWKVINKSGDNEITVLSNEKHLLQEMTLPAGEYILYFTATEKNTGLFWRQSYKLASSMHPIADIQTLHSISLQPMALPVFQKTVSCGRKTMPSSTRWRSSRICILKAWYATRAA